MMDDKQLLQVLERLGRSSRIAWSFAASDMVEGEREMKKRQDQLCADTIRKIIGDSTNNNRRRSFAASAPSSTAAAFPNPNPNANRVKVLYNFVIKNHKL